MQSHIRDLSGHKRFAHQRFADSRESIRRKMAIFEALGQIRANRVFSPIRIESRVICVQSLAAIPIFGRSNSQRGGFFFETRIDSQENIRDSRANHESIRANRPT